MISIWKTLKEELAQRQQLEVKPVIIDRQSDDVRIIREFKGLISEQREEIERLSVLIPRETKLEEEVPVEKALVSAVPLRSGGGTRLKILEAMALGTPVVSTSIGCEGLHVENNHNILIADNPADFAQQITNLLTDLELWNRISKNGRTLVEENYDWLKISSEYRAILEELAQRP